MSTCQKEDRMLIQSAEGQCRLWLGARLVTQAKITPDTWFWKQTASTAPSTADGRFGRMNDKSKKKNPSLELNVARPCSNNHKRRELLLSPFYR